MSSLMSTSGKFSWLDYQGLAEKLWMDSLRTEAGLRSVASRAYYFAYHAVTDAAYSRGYSLPGDPSQGHSELPRWLGSCGNWSVARNLSKTLGRMKRNRHHADYKDDPFTPEQAETSLILSRQVKEYLGILGDVSQPKKP